jgi:hypothetical protein
MKHSISTNHYTLKPEDLKQLSDGSLSHRRDEYRRIMSIFEPYSTPEAQRVRQLLTEAILSVERELKLRSMAQADEPVAAVH